MWDAARMFYQTTGDHRYCWIDNTGTTHISDLPPLPWFSRWFREHFASFAQRYVIGDPKGSTGGAFPLPRGAGIKMNDLRPAESWWADCFPQHTKDRVGLYVQDRHA